MDPFSETTNPLRDSTQWGHLASDSEDSRTSEEISEFQKAREDRNSAISSQCYSQNLVEVFMRSAAGEFRYQERFGSQSLGSNECSHCCHRMREMRWDGECLMTLEWNEGWVESVKSSKSTVAVVELSRVRLEERKEINLRHGMIATGSF